MKQKHLLLQEIVEKSGLTQEAFGLKMGIKKTTMNSYYNGKREISYKVISLLQSTFHINPNYFFKENELMFLTNDGTVEKSFETEDNITTLTNRERKTIERYLTLNDQNTIDSHVDFIFKSEKKKEKSKKVVSINKYKEEISKTLCIEDNVNQYEVGTPIRAAGGVGIMNGDPSYETITVKELPKINFDVAIPIVGDSMEPTIPNGSLVFIKHQPTLEIGETGIFETENGTVCKKYYVNNNKVELRSINPKYHPILPEEIRLVGKVVSILKP